MFSRFFIDRPVFATVLALLIVLIGLVSIAFLPVDRYPRIVPPSVQITASYPGADAVTMAESVAEPIEQRLSAVPNLLYFSSQSGNDGSLSITATFEIGTDQDVAAVDIQNRLTGAYARLPEEVVRRGLEVTKASSGMLAIVALESDDPRYDDVFLSNYAIINVLNTLRRERGVGNVSIFGSRTYSMRIWIDPDRLTRLGMTMREVVAAIRDQNNLFPTGTIAERPTDDTVELTIPVQTEGRLLEARQYEQIILRAFGDGRVLRLSDVARVELGSASYDRIGRVNQRPTALMMISMQTDANALETIANVKRAMRELSATFPPGVSYRIPYDTTTFITASMKEVVKTLIEAVLLVILVVFIFLQSWRATLIPLIAIPVSIIGTFAGMAIFGFSINTLTLFGMVLSIGIVVDDAIVVVENVERLMAEKKLGPREATIEAMGQVSGALIAIVLVLVAVFVPVAFLGGLTGQLYRQFAVTIAVSVSISGLIALTLSPALCRLLLRPHSERRSLFLFRWFNQFFDRTTRGYLVGVQATLRHALPAVVIFLALSVLSYRLMQRIPTGFLPSEDQGFFSVSVLLPDGASLDRTDNLMHDVETFVMDHPAVRDVIGLLGNNAFTGGGISSNTGSMFVALKPFEERRGKDMRSIDVINAIRTEFRDRSDGLVYANLPPAVQGIGQRAGFQLELQDRGTGTIRELAEVSERFMEAAERRPELEDITGDLRFSSPRLFVDVDRERTKLLGLNLTEVYDTLQTYLGTVYVNDFNLFGRVWRVYMQAEPRFRDDPNDISSYFVRGRGGEMIPLSTVVTSEFRTGSNMVSRFNGFSSVQITGVPAAGYSTGEAMRALREVARDTLPQEYQFEWSGASFQEVRAGRQAPIIIAFGLMVVFLVLAALYERWLMPIAVLLVVPFAVFGALVAILWRDLPQDLYFQIGLLVLVGLAVKNAILLVEFCAAIRRSGVSAREAALTAARIRFRPIVMTSMAFVLGVVPLAIASGAGAAARHSIGTGVIGGMLAATFLAPIFVPLFFVVFDKLSSSLQPDLATDGPEPDAATAVVSPTHG